MADHYMYSMMVDISLTTQATYIIVSSTYGTIDMDGWMDGTYTHGYNLASVIVGGGFTSR
jgi:hypothetical protein